MEGSGDNGRGVMVVEPAGRTAGHQPGLNTWPRDAIPETA